MKNFKKIIIIISLLGTTLNPGGITDLPEEIILNIFYYLEKKDLAKVLPVSSKLSKVTQGRKLWKPYKA